MAGGRTVELLTRGDVLRPWRDDNDAAQLHVDQNWKICEPAQLAVLDRRQLLRTATHRDPQLQSILHPGPEAAVGSRWNTVSEHGPC